MPLGLFPLTGFLALTFVSILATAQDLGVPTTWRDDSSDVPLAQRISTSQSAFNMLLTQLDSSTQQFNGIGYWQSGNVWSALANQDRITGEKSSSAVTTNKALVTNALNTAIAQHPNYSSGWWGTAAIYGYRAYEDTTLLNNAVDTWNSVTQYVITSADAASGKHPLKNFTLEGSCDGVTMAGGVFWTTDETNVAVNAITTGLYVTLSSYLAEITNDSKYVDAAIASASWIKAHDYNTTSSLVLDTVNADDCTTSPATWLFTYNSGKFIEGLSVLAQITGDSQWQTLMIDTLAAAVKSVAWQGANGIITEGATTDQDNDGVGFKAIFVRGLYEAFERNTGNTDLRGLVHSYIDVQYNALLDLAYNATDDSYSANWLGPPGAFTAWGQLAALDVLVSAIGVNDG